MADKLMYPIGSFKYANRMMKAGDDPVLMPARDQKLYAALKVASPDEPRTARAVATETVAPAEQPAAAPKRTTRKRRAKK